MRRSNSLLPRLGFGIALGIAVSAHTAFGAITPSPQNQKVQLQLANGDKLTGELLWRAEGSLRFRSAVLGDITLAESDAAILELPDESEKPNAPAANVKSAASGPKPGLANQAQTRSDAPEPGRWKGKMEVGYTQQSGPRDTLNYNLRLEGEKTVRKNALRASARTVYAEQNESPSADRTDASLRWRYQLTQRAFTQSQTIYYADTITQIDTNVEQNAGLGYRILNSTRHTANLGAGVTGQYREWAAGTNGFAPYGEVFQDYIFKINERITLNQDLVAQYSPSDRAFNIPSRGSPATVDPDAQNYKVRFNGSLQGKVTERVSVNFRFEYELDNAIKLEDAREAQRITSSIGYAF
jgi:putative salt-induced outer membrane protein YdiY